MRQKLTHKINTITFDALKVLKVKFLIKVQYEN